jgi:hypothetical protein
MVTKENFQFMTKAEQNKVNHADLKEIATYYGGWDALRKVIDSLENNENEEAYEKHTSGGSDAFSGGFCETH